MTVALVTAEPRLCHGMRRTWFLCRDKARLRKSVGPRILGWMVDAKRRYTDDVPESIEARLRSATLEECSRAGLSKSLR